MIEDLHAQIVVLTTESNQLRQDKEVYSLEIEQLALKEHAIHDLEVQLQEVKMLYQDSL